MDIEDLKTFLAVSRTQSFGRASRELHRTQPAISRRISSLEGRYGTMLLERLPSGVKLTAAGLALVPFAAQIIAALADSHKACREKIAGDGDCIGLTAVGTLVGTEFALCLRQWRLRFPASTLRVSTADSPHVEGLVASGEADIGLRYGCRNADGTHVERLGNDTMVFVCSPDAGIVEGETVSISRLSKITWVTFHTGRPSRDLLERAVLERLREGRDEDPELLQCDSLSAQKALIQSGLGVGLLPLRFVVDDLSANRLRTFAIEGAEVAMPIYLVVRRKTFEGKALLGLIELFRECFN